MILHNDYTALIDDYKMIKDQLELSETVETLRRETGQTPDLFTGIVQAVRPPQVNYVIGHGALGIAADWEPGEFADQLVNRRGLRTDDLICLITCMAGEADGYGEQLARELGVRGAVGVRVQATEHYVNWNSGGVLLLTTYETDDAQVAKANAAWTAAEDKALYDFVANLKAAAAAAIDKAFAKAPQGAVALVLGFVEQRPADNKRNLAGLVGKAQKATGADQIKALRNLVGQALAVPVLSGGGRLLRDATYAQFAGELKRLIGALYMHADPDSGGTVADEEIGKVRRLLREVLAAAWPAYSVGFYDRLRTITTGPQATLAGKDQAGTWKVFVSTAPRAPVQGAVGAQVNLAVDQILTEEQLATRVTRLDNL